MRMLLRLPQPDSIIMGSEEECPDKRGRLSYEADKRGRLSYEADKRGRLSYESGPQRRRGVVVLVELLLVVPILLIILLGIAQFYLMATAREELLGASRLGARVAAAGSSNQKDQVRSQVQGAVSQALGTGRLHSAQVQVTWPDEVTPPPHGTTDWVQVTISIPLKSVVPDVLGWAGMTLGNNTLVVATVAKQE